MSCIVSKGDQQERHQKATAGFCSLAATLLLLKQKNRRRMKNVGSGGERMALCWVMGKMTTLKGMIYQCQSRKRPALDHDRILNLSRVVALMPCA